MRIKGADLNDEFLLSLLKSMCFLEWLSTNLCHSSQHREGVRGIGHLVVWLYFSKLNFH